MAVRKKSQRRARRKYDDEFKADVVALVRGGQSVAEVSRNLDLTSSAVRAWIERADPVQENSISDDDKAELTRLRAEVKRLRQERDILAKDSLLREGVDVKCEFVDAEKAAFFRPATVQGARAVTQDLLRMAQSRQERAGAWR